MNNENETAMSQLPPEAVLPQMILGGLMQKSIWTAAKLGIADLLAEKSQTLKRSPPHRHARRVFVSRSAGFWRGRAFLRKTADEKFEFTPIAELLRSDAPNSMRDYAIMMGEDWIWQAYGELMHSGQNRRNRARESSGNEFF